MSFDQVALDSSHIKTQSKDDSNHIKVHSNVNPSGHVASNISISTGTLPLNPNLDGSLSKRRMPIYIRIVPKDIWLRFHVSPNHTIGSIIDTALLKLNAPDFDPTLSPYFYQHASSAAKLVISPSPTSKSKTDVLPKSFISPCPKPAPTVSHFVNPSISLRPSSSASFSGSRPSTSSRPFNSTSFATDTPFQNPLLRSVFASPSSTSQQSSPFKVKLSSRARMLSSPSLSSIKSASPSKHPSPSKSLHRCPSLTPIQQTSLSTDPPCRVDSPPLLTGNQEAKQEEAKARAFLLNLSKPNPTTRRINNSVRSEHSVDQTSTTPFFSDSASTTLDADPSSLLAETGLDPHSVPVTVSDDDSLIASPQTTGSHGIFSQNLGSDSNPSLAETSSNSSTDFLTTTDGDAIWGTQREEMLLRRQDLDQVQDQDDALVSSESQLIDRPRSRTVTAADVTVMPQVSSRRQLQDTCLASFTPAATHRDLLSSTKTAAAAATTTTHVEPFKLLPAQASQTSAHSQQTDGVALDGGRIAGIHIDEMSQWKEATHALSKRFSAYSFSNGMLLEDWKTVASYKLRPFELLELQFSLPTERVHLDRGATRLIREAVNQGRSQPDVDSALLEAYFEAWVYVLKHPNQPTKAARWLSGTWKLRWITVRGGRLDMYRKKPRPGNVTMTTSLNQWKLTYVKWVSSDETPVPSSFSLSALDSIYPYSLTVAFSNLSTTDGSVTGSLESFQRSNANLTLRCITKFDHDALLNLFNRAYYYRSSSYDSSLTELIGGGWRRNAVFRALIAGRGGTVQPGKSGKEKGRNAKCRTRLRPSGWNLDWEDADQWSSQSELEHVVVVPKLKASLPTTTSESRNIVTLPHLSVGRKFKQPSYDNNNSNNNNKMSLDTIPIPPSTSVLTTNHESSSNQDSFFHLRKTKTSSKEKHVVIGLRSRSHTVSAYTPTTTTQQMTKDTELLGTISKHDENLTPPPPPPPPSTTTTTTTQNTLLLSLPRTTISLLNRFKSKS